MTETTAGATLGSPAHNRIGSVGKPFEGTGLRIADPDEMVMGRSNSMEGTLCRVTTRIQRPRLPQ